MKFQTKIIVNQPLKLVRESFTDHTFMRQWQPTLKAIHKITGQVGAVNTQTQLVYEENGREIIMKETILDSQADRVLAIYTTPGIENQMRTTFEKIDAQTTKIVCESEFKFTTLTFKIIMPFMRGSFLKRTTEDLLRFKTEVEKHP